MYGHKKEAPHTSYPRDAGSLCAAPSGVYSIVSLLQGLGATIVVYGLLNSPPPTLERPVWVEPKELP